MSETLKQILIAVIILIVIVAVISFVGGSCNFSIGDFSAGGGSK